MKSKDNSSTVDIDDQIKFDKLKNNWWNTEGPMKALHHFNKVRINYIKECLGEISQNSFKPFSNMDILDIGCGGGILSEPLSRLGGNVTGLDSNHNAISVAKKHSKENLLKIKYIADDLKNFTPSKQYDLVTCMEVIEHVTNLDVFINEVKKFVKPGGYFIGSTINKSVSSFLLAIVAAEYVFNLLPKKTHEWNKFVRPEILKEVLENRGFFEFHVSGAVYNPYLKDWYFSKFKKVNYLFSAKKLK